MLKRSKGLYFIILSLVLLCVLSLPLTAYAEGYGPWVVVPAITGAGAIEDTDDPGEGGAGFFYQDPETLDPLTGQPMTIWVEPGSEEYERIKSAAEEEHSSFEKMIASTIYQISRWLIVLESNDSNFDISMDGLITGQGARFTLQSTNRYGIAGAHIYVAVRGVVFSLYFIYAAWLLLKQAFLGSSKGMVELKEGIVGLVFSFVMIYLFPQVVQAFLALQSFLCSEILRHLSGQGGVNIKGINDAIAMDWETTKNVPIALVSLGFSFAPLFYMVYYVTIAFTEAVLFGFYPIINLLGLKNKKVLTDFYGTFFSNLAIPVIDCALFLIPITFFKELQNNGMSVKSNFVLTLIVLVSIWCIQPARNGLLRVLGNAAGVSTMGRGMGALMAMARMARMSGRALSGGGNGGDNDISDREKAALHQQNADIEASQKAGLADTLGDKLNAANNDLGETGINADSLSVEDMDVANGSSFMGAGDEGGTGSFTGEGSLDGDGEFSRADLETENMNYEGQGAEVESAEGLSGDYSGEASFDGSGYGGIDEQVVGEAELGADSIGGGLDGGAVEIESSDGLVSAGDLSSGIGEVDARNDDVDLRAENLSAMDQARDDQISAQNAIAAGDAQVADIQAEFPDLRSAGEEQANLDKVISARDEAMPALIEAKSENTGRIETLTAERADLQGQLNATPESNDVKRTNLQGRIDARTGEIESLQAKNNTIDAQIKSHGDAVVQAQARVTAAENLATAKMGVSHAKQDLNNANQRYANAQQKEANFASASSSMGGPATSYSSRQQYDQANYVSDVRMGRIDARTGEAIDSAREQRRQAIVNHRNFDSKSIATTTILTEQEKADFYTKRANINRVKEGAGKVIGGTATAIGFIGGMYGGSQAMVGGAMVGGAVGEVVTDKVASPLVDHASTLKDYGTDLYHDVAPGVKRKFTDFSEHRRVNKEITSHINNVLSDNVDEGVDVLNGVTNSLDT